MRGDEREGTIQRFKRQLGYDMRSLGESRVRFASRARVLMTWMLVHEVRRGYAGAGESGTWTTSRRQTPESIVDAKLWQIAHGPRIGDIAFVCTLTGYRWNYTNCIRCHKLLALGDSSREGRRPVSAPGA